MNPASAIGGALDSIIRSRFFYFASDPHHSIRKKTRLTKSCGIDPTEQFFFRSIPVSHQAHFGYPEEARRFVRPDRRASFVSFDEIFIIDLPDLGFQVILNGPLRSRPTECCGWPDNIRASALYKSQLFLSQYFQVRESDRHHLRVRR
tara:strand:+ start:1200 stop:1643 length:444 start_codon:yes stop_codon:yes gene_type:complete